MRSLSLANTFRPRTKNSALRFVALGLSICLYGAACFGAQDSGPVLHIAAAADLAPVLPAILGQFEKKTGIHASASYQSSATLTQEILNGAPFDMFFAADMGFPQKLVAAGFTLEASPVPYARGTLVLWSRKDASVLKHAALSLATLKDPFLQSVAIANPDHAPYGRAAQAAIKSLHLDATLQGKLRVAANIAQTAQFVDSGNAEVGLISLTSARSLRLAQDGTFITIPAAAYPALLQGAVILKRASKADQRDAEKLLKFLQETETQSMLTRMGLNPPD